VEFAMRAQLIFLSLLTICLIVVLLMHEALASKSTTAFIEKASIGNQFEISSSRLALQNSQNEQVKNFAQQMVDDHSQVANKLTEVTSDPAAELSQPATNLDAKHQKMLDKLDEAKAEDFDKKYVDAQVKSHNEAVSLFRDYSKNGDHAGLKGFAAETLPALEQHQQMAKNLKSSYKAAY
jgi:putative membrane protein